MTNRKTLETRLRRMADRRGLRLQKSRARDPGGLTFNGYQLVDLRNNTLVFGHGKLQRGYGATIEEIEQFLTGGKEVRS